MKRATTLTACTAAALMLAAGPAAAGEWNANGKATGAVGNAASACFYSGLDEQFAFRDDPDNEINQEDLNNPEDFFDHTQNYGQIVRMLGPGGPDGFTPATAGCNPNRPVPHE